MLLWSFCLCSTHTTVIFLSNCITVLLISYYDSIYQKWSRKVSCSSWSWNIFLTMWIAWHIATDLICLSSLYGGDLVGWLKIMAMLGSAAM